MRISDWSSDVCSSDLLRIGAGEEILDEEFPPLEIGEHALSQMPEGFGRHGLVDRSPPDALGGVPVPDDELVVRRTSGVLTGGADQRPARTDPAFTPPQPRLVQRLEIGRASCRERVCKSV